MLQPASKDGRRRAWTTSRRVMLLVTGRCGCPSYNAWGGSLNAVSSSNPIKFQSPTRRKQRLHTMVPSFSISQPQRARARATFAIVVWFVATRSGSSGEEHRRACSRRAAKKRGSSAALACSGLKESLRRSKDAASSDGSSKDSGHSMCLHGQCGACRSTSFSRIPAARSGTPRKASQAAQCRTRPSSQDQPCLAHRSGVTAAPAGHRAGV